MAGNTAVVKREQAESWAMREKEWEAGKGPSVPSQPEPGSALLSLPPVQAAVQLAEGRGQPLLQDVVDHLLWVVVVVLQAGQDEALTKVWQQVLHLGDE
jgi:hypothetical protein